MDEVLLGESEYFVVVDNWDRGLIGKVYQNQIIGRVLGYDESEMIGDWSQTERAL